MLMNCCLFVLFARNSPCIVKKRVLNYGYGCSSPPTCSPAVCHVFGRCALMTVKHNNHACPYLFMTYALCSLQMSLYLSMGCTEQLLHHAAHTEHGLWPLKVRWVERPDGICKDWLLCAVEAAWWCQHMTTHLPLKHKPILGFYNLIIGQSRQGICQHIS